MNAATASLSNAIILVLIGLWGAYATDWSPTSFIPVAFGVILLALNGGVRKENKVIAHIAVLLTLVVLVALFKPLMGALERGGSATIRIVIMQLSSLIAMIYFIKSFRDARKAREAAGS